MKSVILSREQSSEREVADAHLGDVKAEKSRGWDLVMTMAKGENALALMSHATNAFSL
jgi:hypothetical protein